MLESTVNWSLKGQNHTIWNKFWSRATIPLNRERMFQKASLSVLCTVLRKVFGRIDLRIKTLIHYKKEERLLFQIMHVKNSIDRKPITPRRSIERTYLELTPAISKNELFDWQLSSLCNFYRRVKFIILSLSTIEDFNLQFNWKLLLKLIAKT